MYPCIQCKISLHNWISEYFRKLLNRLLLWYLRKVQRIYRWDNRRYTSANSQDKHGEQLNFMFFACKNARNDSKVCCPLIGQKNTKVFWHQSEARTAAAVWNCSGKTLGAIHSTKIQTGPTGKRGPPKRWTRFFETCLVGPNRSIEFWTEISGNFGWMDRAHCPQGLFTPFFTFLRAIFSRPFSLSLAPTICPWVSEDAGYPTLKRLHGKLWSWLGGLPILADRATHLGGSLHLSWTLVSSGHFFLIDTGHDGSFISH